MGGSTAEPRPRDDPRADARGCLRRARQPTTARRISHEPASHDDPRLEAAFQEESRIPFVLYIVVGTPLIYATMTYFLFQGGERQATLVAAAVGSGDDGHLVADHDRGGRRAPAAASPRDPRVPGRLADAILGDVPPDHARDRLDRDLLARHRAALRAPSLRRARLVADWPAFIVAVPPTILSIGMLGFLMGSAFVRFRAAWMVGNLFEFPVWTICGFLIPLALLPDWVEPIAWALAPTWGMSALRKRRSGARPGPTSACAAALDRVRRAGRAPAQAFLRLARERATLGLT